MHELDGQVGIVTGGGRGIGRAIAEALARDGAAVCVAARSADEVAETAMTIAAAGGRVLGLPTDVRDKTAVHRLVAETEKQFGPVTLLVNNAGTPGPAGNDWGNCMWTLELVLLLTLVRGAHCNAGTPLASAEPKN